MKERVISAVIALLIVVPLVLLGGMYFNALVLVVGILGLKELLDLKKGIPTFVKYLSYVLLSVLLIFGYEYINNVLILNKSLLIIVTLILLSSLLVFRNKKYSIDDVFYIMGSILLISSAFVLLSIVRSNSLLIFVYLFLITICTDTFAYLIGSKFGKHKLMPDVSPNKSVEGFFGGLFFGVIISTLFYMFMIDPTDDVVFILLMTNTLSILGQMGDLVFSSVKRHYKIKDFSNLMPGHGGVLDRLDSIIFVVYGYIIFSVIL